MKEGTFQHMVEEEPEDIEISDTIKASAGLIWRWSWLLLLLALLAGGITYQVSSRQTPIYQATTLVMVSGAPGSQSDSYNTIVMSEKLVQTYAQIMTTRPVKEGVAEKLQFPISQVIRVTPITNTQLMRVSVEDTDPERAALVANTLVSVFIEQIQSDQAARYAGQKRTIEAQLAVLDNQLQATSGELAAPDLDSTRKAQLDTTLAQYRQTYASLLSSYEQLRLAEAQSAANVVQKDPAVAPLGPIKPKPVRNALIAAALGLMLGAGVIFLSDYLNDTIRDPEEITRRWGIPILATIANFKTTDDGPITARQPRSPVSEAFRSLRTNLQFVSIDHPLHRLVVTSPTPGDGKSTIVANLGVVLAQSGRDTVLIDADLRRPTLHKQFRLPNRIGMTDIFLRSKAILGEAIQKTDIEDLSVITSGSLPPNPSELLSSTKMVDIIQQVGDAHEIVILDCPPVLAVTDTTILAPRVDGVLLVVKPSVTKRMAVRHVIEQMHRAGANLLGVVLNDVKISSSGYNKYQGYYQGYYMYGNKYNWTDESDAAVARRARRVNTGGVFRDLFRVIRKRKK